MMDPKALKYCELILQLYYAQETWSQDMVDRVLAWLVNGEHCREKDLVLRRLFYEMLEERSDEEPIPEISDRIKEIINN